MFVFGGYIDMRGASDELWQYELGECLHVNPLSTLVPVVIAVIGVISGMTYKRGERVNSALYWPFRLVCMPFKTKEYLNAGSTPITAIQRFYFAFKIFSRADLLASPYFHAVFPRKWGNLIPKVSLRLLSPSVEHFGWTGYVRLLTRITCIFGLADTLKWIRIKWKGDGPSPRYNHSAAVGAAGMWVYGGLEGLQARNDLWRWSFGM